MSVNSNAKDSSMVIKGFWEKGKFINKIELHSPFKLVPLTNYINNFTMRKLSGTDGSITIIVKSTTGGAQTISGNFPTIYVPVLSDIQLIEGIYNEKIADEKPQATFNKYILRQVTFPFAAILSFKMPNTSISFNQSVQQLSVEIPGNGNYYLEVNLDE